MAFGDVKKQKVSYGGWGGSRARVYDDEGRGQSERVWERFQRDWSWANFEESWLFELSQDRHYELVASTRDRYGVEDWSRFWNPSDEEYYTHHVTVESTDGRVARLVRKHCGDETWLKFHKLTCQQYLEKKHKLEEESKWRTAENEKKWQERRAAAEAERMRVVAEQTKQIRQEVNLVAGAIQSDMATALAVRSSYGHSSGTMYSPVRCAIDGKGFRQDHYESAGMGLQISVSLDWSNSMWYNELALPAIKAFRAILGSLLWLEKDPQYVGSLVVNGFVFARYDNGKGTSNLKKARYYRSNVREDSEYWLGPLEAVRDVSTNVPYDAGEDTWFHPLFEEIERWEQDNDPGMHRLDIVITDGVFEHPTDISKCNNVQHRRDGSLMTVFLNFLPEDKWADQSLPLRCYQYEANPENIQGLLRTILMEFAGTHM